MRVGHRAGLLGEYGGALGCIAAGKRAKKVATDRCPRASDANAASDAASALASALASPSTPPRTLPPKPTPPPTPPPTLPPTQPLTRLPAVATSRGSDADAAFDADADAASVNLKKIEAAQASLQASLGTSPPPPPSSPPPWILLPHTCYLLALLTLLGQAHRLRGQPRL